MVLKKKKTAVCLRLASPKTIQSWTQRMLPNGEIVGEITENETLNYRTQKPVPNGLFCERIFGPVKDWECACGRYKGVKLNKKKYLVCEFCGVQLTTSNVRRKRLGYIKLVSPIVHVWFLKSRTSYLAYLFDLKSIDIQFIVYFLGGMLNNVDPKEKKTVFRKFEMIENFALSVSKRFFKKHKFSYSQLKEFEQGSAALYEKIQTLDINEVENELKVNLNWYQGKDKNGQVFTEPFKVSKLEKYSEYKLLIRRLRFIEKLKKSQVEPKWMILLNLPVLPPDLRPIIEVQNGQLATSDLNNLYKTVLYRNNRIRKYFLGWDTAPYTILREEFRLLQYAVDAVIDNSRAPGKAPILGSSNQPLKSLSDALQGKEGRFRKNLLGKRVDYSGRSVIVVEPKLHLHQCGLPKIMVLELFQPFLIQKLLQKGFAANMNAAKRILQTGIHSTEPKNLTPELNSNISTNSKGTATNYVSSESFLLPIIKEVLENHLVFLNRAPTLHRLGILAFEPILVPGKSVKLHPLVCSGFNADFDGDQMAVHVPLSEEAQAEARLLMLSTLNLVSPSNGQPIVSPTQDIILGTYYLTHSTPVFQNKLLKKKRIKKLTVPKKSRSLGGEYLYFFVLSDILLAYHNAKVSLHTPIWIPFSFPVDNNIKCEYLIQGRLSTSGGNYQAYPYSYGAQTSQISTLTFFLRTTPGRVFFHQILKILFV